METITPVKEFMIPNEYETASSLDELESNYKNVKKLLHDYKKDNPEDHNVYMVLRDYGMFELYMAILLRR
jgi:hypothetical protein